MRLSRPIAKSNHLFSSYSGTSMIPDKSKMNQGIQIRANRITVKMTYRNLLFTNKLQNRQLDQ